MTFKQVFSTDKLLHAAVCFVLTVVFSAIFAAQPTHLVWGAVIALLFAIGKEAYDIISFNVEWKIVDKKGSPYQTVRRKLIVDCIFDFGFDIIGIVIALFCLTALGC